MKKVLSLTLLLCTSLFVSSAPPTCYSRILSLSQEISDGYADLQKSETVDPCVRTLPMLYLDIHVITELKRVPNIVERQFTLGLIVPGIIVPIVLRYLLKWNNHWFRNYCVLAKIREFVGYPQCWHVPQLDALKEKARNLYTIMISVCRRDLVFLTDDCGALETPSLRTTDHSTVQI